jgi:thiol-disulfide isomerase/thioredoxin
MDLSGRERDKLFLSRAGQSFADCSYLSGADGAEDARAFAHADLDRDGHEDLIVVSRNAPLLRVYRNAVGPARGGRFVGLSIKGGGTANRDGIGARVIARCGKTRLLRETERGAGFATTNSPSLTINLPAGCDALDELTVRFPGSETRVFQHVTTDRFYRVVEGKGIKEVPGVYAHRSTPRAQAPASPSALATAVKRLTGASGIVVVSYWATWCEACRREAPRVDALAASLAGRAQVVGVSLEPKDDGAAVSTHRAAHPAQHRLLPFDPELARATEALFGKTPPLPSAVVVDMRSGRVLLKTPGTPTRSALEQCLVR